ncbi:MAG: ribosome silencing factor [Verrucomicrobia bacterium]|nr:ribosome silencing factor [Verrucomicrobiota bacterium]
MKSKQPASPDLVKICFKVLDDKKAEDIRVLDVSAQSSITDFLVVATATSSPHLRALRVELEKAIDASTHRIVGIELADDSGWTVIDAFDVTVHLFLNERRKQYGLENLWKDAAEVVLAEPEIRPTKRSAAKRSPARAKPGTPKKLRKSRSV